MDKLVKFDIKASKKLTHLIVSEGVTAKTASTIPAPKPASKLRGALTFPWISIQKQPFHSIPTEEAIETPTHLRIGKHPLKMIIAHESYSSFDGVAYYERHAARIKPCYSFGAYRVSDNGDGALALFGKGRALLG